MILNILFMAAITFIGALYTPNVQAEDLQEKVSNVLVDVDNENLNDEDGERISSDHTFNLEDDDDDFN